MDTGELTAWHGPTRQPVTLRWARGVITHVAPGATPPPEDVWVMPSLLDVQVNGYAGVDFQQDALTTEQLLQATRALRADGCASYFLTLITDEWPRLCARLKHLAALRRASPELQAAILGWHIEGPFLSSEPGFHGAHNPALMLDPSAGHIHELRALTGRDPLLLTLAPERPGGIAVTRLATSLGIKISLGHTNASAAVLAEAVAAGATLFTHLANGCPRELDRHDNILWRVLETPGLTPSLIPDGLHVSPAPFRLIHRVRDQAVFYTTDAMAAAGASPGRYTLGRVEVEVGADQIVRQPGKTNFAGSALRPVDGVFRAAAMLGGDWQEAWRRASVVPTRLMGVGGALNVGDPATFCVLRPSAGKVVPGLEVIWQGRRNTQGPHYPNTQPVLP